MAMRTQQLNNVAVVVTNPVCSTPRAPTINAIPTDDTTAQVTWKSLPNSGSFITGWIVSWGTTSGGPYPNSSGVLPLVPRVYTATGLTSGTQYFFIVTAVTNIAGCTSNSPERSATTTGTNPGLLLSLVSYWKLDEAAGAVRADSIGANNVSQGADAVGQSTTAIIGDSAQFTLASAGLQAASNSTLQFAAGASKSFSGWFLTSTLVFTQALIGKWTDVGNDREYVLVTSGGTTTFRTRNLANGANVDVASTVTIAANTWHHVAFGYDNLNSVIWIQVDGETRVTTASTGVRSSGVQFRLGSCVDFNTTGNNGLDGFMDEWAMWSRVITNAEVQQLAASFSLPGIQATITAGSDNANRWNSKVQADGGAALSAGTLTAFAACVDGMISDGTYNSILVFNSIPKDGLTAVLRPWSRIGNTFAAWTNHNFVAGDLTVNGLTGDGATKYLDTGFNASTQIQSQNNSSLGAMIAANKKAMTGREARFRNP